MAIKEFLDRTTFSDLKSASDLYGNTIRKGMGFSAYGDKTEFDAIVLSAPIFLLDADISSGRVGQSAEGGKMTKFGFKARIITSPSPHEYLPDPCDPNISANTEAAARIINMHTTFFSAADYTRTDNVMPKVGDLVRVRLSRNIFSFNLQYGTYLSLKSYANAGNQDLSECQSTMSKFYTGNPIASKYPLYEFVSGPDITDPSLQVNLAGAKRYGGERPKEKITQIVVHSTETHNRTGTIKIFQTTEKAKSAHYVVGIDGVITQMLPENVIGYHAGNWEINKRSVGIEIVGFAHSTNWKRDRKTQTEAVEKLVANIAKRNSIVPSKSTIIRHLDVPGKWSDKDKKFWGGCGDLGSKKRNPCWNTSVSPPKRVTPCDPSDKANWPKDSSGKSYRVPVPGNLAGYHTDPGPEYPYDELITNATALYSK